MDDFNLWLVGGGLFIGLLFGIVVERTQFCMVTAVSNVVLMRDFRHAHGYFAALLIAVLGTLLVLLAFALTAAATYFGALEPYRVWLTQNTSIELDAVDSALSNILGLLLWVGPAVIALVCFVGLLFLGHVRRSSRLISAGIVVGALIVAGWYITGYLSQDDFSEHRASSITIAGPYHRFGYASRDCLADENRKSGRT